MICRGSSNFSGAVITHTQRRRAEAKITTLKHGQDATRGATSLNRDLDFRRQPFFTARSLPHLGAFRPAQSIQSLRGGDTSRSKHKPPNRNRNVSIFSFYRLCIPAQPDLAHYAFLSIIHYPMLNSFYTGLWELLLERPPCPTHGDSDIVLDPTRECVDISNSVPLSSASRNILTS